MMMDESWLNPNIAQEQLVTLVLVVLVVLIVVPLIFGLLMYFVLGLLNRVSDARRRRQIDREAADES